MEALQPLLGETGHKPGRAASSGSRFYRLLPKGRFFAGGTERDLAPTLFFSL